MPSQTKANPTLTSNHCEQFLSPRTRLPPQIPAPQSNLDSSLSPKVLAAVSNVGYEERSPIQMVTVPFGRDRRDLIGTAKTGLAKTAAFVLPNAPQHIHHPSGAQSRPCRPHAVVLAPTRDLALQIEPEAEKLRGGWMLRSCRSAAVSRLNNRGLGALC